MATEHVIIGGGPGGMNAIETIRGYDADASITLISDEPAYSRMALPYYISGNIPVEQVNTGDDDYFGRLGVKTRFGVSVSEVNPHASMLTLSDGSMVPFDNLLIATGSSAQKLNIPGADGDGVHNLWTVADAEKTVDALGSDAEVAFIGAGFIGFIILNAMHKRGARLKVIELEDQVLPRMLDAQGASLVGSWLESQGVEVHTGVSVQAIDHGHDGVKTLQLSDGSSTRADVVIVATGIRANIGFLAGSGIETNEGVLVNNRCQTSAANVYAAGDVAEGPDLSTGGQAVHAIQPTAVDHGRIAGANMAGHDIAYRGSLLMNILDVQDLDIASFGDWSGSDDVTVLLSESENVYRKLVWNDDRITGAIIMGPARSVWTTNDVGMLKGLIQSGTRLGGWKAYLQEHPRDIKRPFVASHITRDLLPVKTLDHPSVPSREVVASS